MIRTRGFCSWNMHLRRNLNNWEVEDMERLLDGYRLGDIERPWMLDEDKDYTF